MTGLKEAPAVAICHLVRSFDTESRVLVGLLSVLFVTSGFTVRDRSQIIIMSINNTSLAAEK